MTKKKAKGKATKKGTAKTKSVGKSKKELNPAEVLEVIAQMVKSEAALMAEAVIGEGKKGQLATVKYLWEVAKIFPEATDGSQASVDEECLAKTLLRRLDVPENPVGRDEEDAPKPGTSAATPSAKPEGENKSGSEPENSEESKEAVLV
jgi:hypothetical protein